jgi:hypothetical protein
MHPFGRPIMLIDTHYATLPMRGGQTARLRDALNTRLTSLRGVAWITVDGDRRDIVLEPGDTFVVDSDQQVLVHALHSQQPLELAVDGAAALVGVA